MDVITTRWSDDDPYQDWECDWMYSLHGSVGNPVVQHHHHQDDDDIHSCLKTPDMAHECHHELCNHDHAEDCVIMNSGDFPPGKKMVI